VIALGSEWSDGGTIFEFEFDALPVVASSLADRVDLLAELLAEGHFERVDVYVSIDHRVEQERRTARLDAAGPPRSTASSERSQPSSSPRPPTGSRRAGSI